MACRQTKRCAKQSRQIACVVANHATYTKRRNGLGRRILVKKTFYSTEVISALHNESIIDDTHSTEDELYLVLEGRGRLRVEGDDQAVEKGTLMYVHAACDHTFFDVEEDLTVIAFFGTATYQRQIR